MDRVCFVILIVSLTILVNYANAAADCGSCPICDHGSGSWTTCASWVPSPLKGADSGRIREFFRCLKYGLSNKVVGHAALKQKVLDLVTHKLQRPESPLVLHFAGDNGVGKTMLAKEISLATSLRAKVGPVCGPRGKCDYGENMLIVSCPSFGLMSDAQAAQRITEMVVSHAQVHKTGIVLLDDAPTLSERVVAALGPLLGTAETFPEHPSVPLSGLLVILTSDFGKEGRTRGRSSQEIDLLIHDQLHTVYNYSNVKYVKTFGFMPFDTQAARDLVTLLVRQTPCRFGTSVVSASITPGAMDNVIQSLNNAGAIVAGNGRAIAALVVEEIDVKVSSYLAEHGVDLRVDVTLAESADGSLALRVTPVGGEL